MLQPMHSRMSSSRPSSIFCGRKGSAIEGRAAPIRSSTPRRTCAHHRVGRGEAADADHRLGGHRLHEVDEGLLVAFLGEARGARSPSPRRLTLTSQRSGSSASIATTSRASASVMPVVAEQLLDREAHGHGAACRRPRPWCPRSARAAAARGSPASRRIRRCAGCAAAAGSASAARGRGRRRRRRCRTPPASRAPPPRGASGAARRCRAGLIARAWCGWPYLCGWCEGASGHLARVEVGRGRPVVRQLDGGQRAVGVDRARTSARARGCRRRPTASPRRRARGRRRDGSRTPRWRPPPSRPRPSPRAWPRGASGMAWPMPLQCGTWKKRFLAVTGPMRTGSNRMS